MESRGNLNFVNDENEKIGIQQVGSTLHWGPDKNFNRYNLTHFQKYNATGFHKDFHRYQMEWTPSYIEFSVDDELLGNVKPPEGGFWSLGNFSQAGIENPWRGSRSIMAPFDDEFFIIINLAVGGTSFFSDNATNHPKKKPWLNSSPTPLKDFWESRGQWLPTWNLDTDDSHLKIDYVKIFAI